MHHGAGPREAGAKTNDGAAQWAAPSRVLQVTLD